MTSPPQLGYTAPMPVLMDEWVTVEVSFDKYTPRLGIDAPKMSVIVPVMPPRIARVSSSNDLSTRIKRHVTVPELEVGPIVDPLWALAQETKPISLGPGSSKYHAQNKLVVL